MHITFFFQGSNFTPLVNLDVGNLQCANLNGTYVAEFKSEEMACEINNCPRFCGCRNRIDDQVNKMCIYIYIYIMAC